MEKLGTYCTSQLTKLRDLPYFPSVFVSLYKCIPKKRLPKWKIQEIATDCARQRYPNSQAQADHTR